MSSENETIDILKVFADAVTGQARVVNRIWLATLTVSFFVLVPKPSSQEPIDLPFGLGKVDQTTFYPLAFAILSVLIIALAAAHMQQIRAHKLAHRVIDKLKPNIVKLPASLHPHDLFDILAIPSLTRVAPLAQWIRGKYQFAANEKNAPTWLRVLSSAFYIILKLVALAVFFAFPGIALFYCYEKVPMAPQLHIWLYRLLMTGGIIAVISLTVVAVADLHYIWIVIKKLYKGEAEEGTEEALG